MSLVARRSQGVAVATIDTVEPGASGEQLLYERLVATVGGVPQCRPVPGDQAASEIELYRLWQCVGAADLLLSSCEATSIPCLSNSSTALSSLNRADAQSSCLASGKTAWPSEV